MSDQVLLLPRTTFRPPSPQGRRRPGRRLNPIMEEEPEQIRNSFVAPPQPTTTTTTRRRSNSRLSLEHHDKIEQWLSPMSDHFPTPRGQHFLAAPIFPATPSCVSSDTEPEPELDHEDDDASSQASSSNPSVQWHNQRRGSANSHRDSIMTDVTEFDDLYDVSDNDTEETDSEETSRKQRLQANGITRNRSGTSRSLRRTPSSASTSSTTSPAARGASRELRRSLAPLVIPEEATAAAAAAAKKKMNLLSPVPPTPPSAVAMSPAVKNFMARHQAQAIPRVSAPPSLDGSAMSESEDGEGDEFEEGEMAQMSAPPTPLIGAQVDSPDREVMEWGGVHLQPGALETLQALAGNGEDYEGGEEQAQIIEVVMPAVSRGVEMAQASPRLPRGLGLLARGTSSASASSKKDRNSLADLTRLEIPSPGGFFSELSSASRRTWNSQTSNNGNPPTSTTAENFYKIPWNRGTAEKVPPPPPRPLHLDDLPSAIVERVIEMPSRDQASEDLPTAIRVVETPVPITARRVPLTPGLPQESQSQQSQSQQQSHSQQGEVVEGDQQQQPLSPVDVNEIIDEYRRHEFATAKQLEETALSHLDRTQMWLTAQRAYLQGVVGFSEEVSTEEPAKQAEGEDETTPEIPVSVSVMAAPEIPAEATVAPKKAVRFSEVVQKQSIPRSLPSKLTRQESAYYRAFTDYLIRTCASDVFIHRQPRFEALQAQRACLRDTHRSQLLGKFQLSVVPQSAKKRMSTNVVRGDDVVVDDAPEKLRADKEAEALAQMHLATWHVAATKLLNGGKLISAPVSKRLLARQSYTTPNGTSSVTTKDRPRILDLGGQGACDWAWHAALQYPNAKVYTLTTKAIRQLSNSNIRGPPNHRNIAVPSLAHPLPFADAHFDLVSARELHSLLKVTGENGVDEWDAVLKECMRVLKPGGYLEFGLLDADIMNAGPLGNAKAVEFGFALQTLGYDPNPTRGFLGRLQGAGFEGVRRAWVCLPVGPKRPPRTPRPAPVSIPTATPAPAPTTSTSTSAPNRPISTASAATTPRTHRLSALVTGSTEPIAPITGLAASWSWERWLLRAEMERAAGQLRLGCPGSGLLGDTSNPRASVMTKGAGKMSADVHAVVEEGRGMGSAFRMLRGYARKPMDGSSSSSKVPVKQVPTVNPHNAPTGSLPAVPPPRRGSIRICLDTMSLV
ncbi:hypothetical protein B0J18DRAFT_363759 [Chaetomium sp. MPI-SDFR-AT-0129]|nr:hypothetical protein B0J18DRAFT_363759 [Chaetomium sp. MPI-SDFR-AT-0129]